MPLAVCLLLTILGMSIIVITPTIALTYSGANETLELLTDLARRSYSQQLQAKILDAVAGVYGVANAIARSPTIRTTIDSLDLDQDPVFMTNNRFLYSFFSHTSPYPDMTSSGFAFHDRLTAVLVPNIDQRGLHCEVYPDDGHLCTIWVITDANLVNGTLGIYEPPGLTFPNDAHSVRPSIGGSWDMPVYSPVDMAPDGTPIYLGIVSFIHGWWRDVPLGDDPGTADFLGWLTITQGTNLYTQVLSAVIVPPDTVIAVWDAASGYMIGSNQESMSLHDLQGVPYTVQNLPLDMLSVPTADILGRLSNGSWTDLHGPVSGTFDVESVGKAYVDLWTVSDDHSLNWCVVIVIPVESIKGPLTASRKKVLANTSVVAISTLVVVAALSILVTAPIRKLTIVMEQATDLDFSALANDGYLTVRAPITEIAAMQTVFHEMLLKFAASIKSHKAFMMMNRDPGGRSSAYKSAVAGGKPVIVIRTREDSGGGTDSLA
ncbi:hypothetical protein HKX48_007537 [Thoreauomyces humboldtii]|nr:hypothetical protein HKX48_007537 [Thoreauomyces humboldtii]